jgi:hypothetical protein
MAALVLAGLAGCSVIPPTQEMSDARQAIKAAQDLSAAEQVPLLLHCAEFLLAGAEQDFSAGFNESARFQALAAKRAGLQAHQLARSLQELRQLTISAGLQHDLGAASPQTLLSQAEAEALRGNVQAAQHYLEQARPAAEAAINQSQLTQARQLLLQMQKEHCNVFDAETLAVLETARQAMARADGKEALRLLESLINLDSH